MNELNKDKSNKDELNKILKRYYITAKIELASPLALSNGFEENTDSDVLRNGNGEAFIPGTSVAGAFRNYLDNKKDKPGIFGYSVNMGSDKDDGRMSTVFISDIYLKDTNVTERDGVKLNYGKTVENKFDYEIVETGASGILKIEQVVREKDIISGEKLVISDEDMSVIDKNVFGEISTLLSALDTGEIRFGSKKNRGCGWIKVNKVYRSCFSSRECNEWIEYCKNLKNEHISADEWTDWKKELNEKSKYISIKVPLRLTGGISIRKYSAKPQQSDYEHITIKDTASGEKIPVIPGSSWNGAVRSQARRIMEELEMPAIDQKIETWFGTDAGNADKKTNKKDNKKTDMRQSMVVFKESIIEGAKELPITRNRVNRFDASTVDGALYSETSYFGGKTELEILVRKEKDKDGMDTSGFKPLLGLLMLVIKELEKGYLAVGGQTAVGRGIFESNGEAEFSGGFGTYEMEKQCCRELAFLKEVM